MTSVLDGRPVSGGAEAGSARVRVGSVGPRLRRLAPWIPGVAVGSLSALWGLGARDLWLDEAYSLGAVHQLSRTLVDTHGTMATYYVLLRPWTAVSTSATWMRILSVLLAVAAVAVVVAVVRRSRGDRAAAAAGLLTSLSPLWLTYAREARSYGLVLLLVALGWLALDHGLSAAEEGSDRSRSARRWWVVHSSVCVLLPLTHGLAAAQVVPHLAAVALAGADRRTWVRAGRGVAASLAVTVALAWRGAATEVGDWVSPLGWRQAARVLEAFTTSDRWAALALLVVVLAGAGVTAASVARTPAGLERARTAVPVLWGLVPIVAVVALSIVRPALVSRYVIGSVPGVAMLLIAAVDGLPSRRDPRLWRALGAEPPGEATQQAQRLTPSEARRSFGTTRPHPLKSFALILVALPLALGHLRVHDRRDDGWSTAARVVADGMRPRDTVLLSRSTTTRPPFEAAWRDVASPTPPTLLPSDRPLGEVLRFEPGDATGTERWNEARRAPGRIWVVGDVDRLELDRLPSLTVDGVAGRPATHREVDRWVEHGARATVVVVLLVPT